MKVAYQGKDGAYSQQAVFEYFGAAEAVSCPSFEAVFDAVVSGECENGMIPIENSVAGSIHQNYDLLLRHNLSIVGEHLLRVRHCLIALPGVKKGEIKKAVSHPQALGQCAGYLRRNNIQPEVGADTAGSVLLVKNAGERTTAAIASRRAAQIYDMEIIEEGIEDDPQNYTRFLVIASAPVVPSGVAKTSIVFTLPNRKGTLYKAIGAFARRDIDLAKIESRPLVGTPWDYLFYLDFLGASHDPNVQAALAELRDLAPMLRVLGSYARFQW
ncbi:MAG: prephenate dehydratase [Chloroflexota bacterium]